MENSVGSTIEKIKLQEQDKEAKLKERRELEATVANLNRGIRDAKAQADKADQDALELQEKTDQLQSQLLINDIRRDALAKQLDACYEELNGLHCLTDNGMREVWDLRSTLTTAIQKTSDECDIWALITKPYNPDLRIKDEPMENEPEEELVNESKLKQAIEKRDRAKADKYVLMHEPELGEEFVRIKNALKYSLEMVENLKR